MSNDTKLPDAEEPGNLSALACARLERSRQTIRQDVQNTVAERNAEQRARASGAPGAWLSSLKSLPGADLLMTAAQQWWTHHPMHSAVSALNLATRSSVQPVANRHPFVLVGAAVLVGAVLMRFLPIRRLFTPALLAGVLPPMLNRLVAKAPKQGWVSVLASLAQASMAKPSFAASITPSSNSLTTQTDTPPNGPAALRQGRAHQTLPG